MKIDQLKASIILSYILTALTIVITLFYTPFMLRSLGQSEFGLYNLIGAFVGTMSILDFGLGNAITRYTAIFRLSSDRAGVSNLLAVFLAAYSLIGLLTFCIGLCFYFNIHLIFQKTLTAANINEARILFLIMLLNVALSFIFNAFFAVINGYERFVAVKLVAIIRTIVMPCVMIPMLYMGFKAIAITILNTVLNIATGLFYIIYVTAVLKVKLRFYYFDRRLFLEILKYSFYIFLGVVVDQIYWRTGQIVLGIVASVSAVAVFSISMQICQYYINFSSAVTGAFLPRATQLSEAGNSEQEINRMFIRVGRFQLMVLGLLLEGFILFGREFLKLWAGAGYEQAYEIILLIMIPLTVPLIQNVGIVILQAKNLHKFRSVTYLITAVANFIISIPLTVRFGGIGAALGTTFSLIIGNIVIINIYYSKKIKLKIFQFFMNMAKILPAFAAAFLIGLVLKTAGEGTWKLFFVKAAAFTVIYCAAVFLIGLNKEEKKGLISIARKLAGIGI